MDNKPWEKKDVNFDVSMGSGDGAEVTELIDLFLMYQISQVEKIVPKENLGAFRDDYLLVTGKTRSDNERIKKALIKLFKKYGLDIEISLNLTEVNYLDVNLNIENGRYKPYLKTNENLKYVNRYSNHWKLILEQIPKGIEKRLNTISSTKLEFNQTKQAFQDALENAGHQYTLKWKKNDTTRPRRKLRKKEVCYYNPPYSKSIKTNIGQKFISLVKKWFCNNPTMKSKFSTSTLKVSYSNCPNISQIINKNNNKILNSINTPTHKECNCTSSACPIPQAPVDRNCRSKDTVYEAEIEAENGAKHRYIGGTSQELKNRICFHRSCTRHLHLSKSCELAKKAHQLTERGLNYTIKWNIKEKSRSFRAGDKTCLLCNCEMYHILYSSGTNLLNYLKIMPCLHRKGAMLEGVT